MGQVEMTSLPPTYHHHWNSVACPKELGKVPGKSAGGVPRDLPRSPPRRPRAPAVAAILGRALGTAHARASLLTSASPLTFSSYFPPIPALSSGASPLWSPCGWRKVNCLAVESCPGIQ